jgi:hypothetical protein
MGAGNWFSLFWTETDWKILVTNTNQYAAKQRTPDLSTGLTPRPLDGSWRPVTVAEMKAYVAIVIVLGVYRIRSYSDFWRCRRTCSLIQKAAIIAGGRAAPAGSRPGVARLGFRQRRVRRPQTLTVERNHNELSWIPHYNTFRASLSRRRFTQIKRYLHVSDPDLTGALTDAEWYKKLEPLSSSICTRSQELAVPGTNTSVDEMMVRFFGRSKHTVRMPKKPIKEGFKIFAICQRGYTYNWLYCSRKTGIANLPLHPKLPPTQAAVLHLALSLPYEDYDFNIYMDNLFTTVPLLIELRDKSIGGTGTARSNAFPRHLRHLDATAPWNTVSGGSTADGKVLGLEWQDQKTVQMLTTLHPLSKKVKRNRKQPRITSTSGAAIRKHFTSVRMEVDIPSAIDDYNHFKGGVDIADQYRESYFTQQTSRRNWLPLFYWLLDIAVINSFLLACTKLRTSQATTPVPSGRKKLPITHKDFRLEVALYLVEEIQEEIQQKWANKLVGRNRSAKNTRQNDHLCYSKAFAVTEVPTTCANSDNTSSCHNITKAEKRKECVSCRFADRQRGLKSVMPDGKRKRATYGSFGCTLCGLSFCKKCAAKYSDSGPGSRK